MTPFSSACGRAIGTLLLAGLGAAPALAQCEPAELPSPGAGLGFGAALDLEGVEAVVGTPLDPGTGGDFGAVHLFDSTGGSWVATQRLAPAVPPLFGDFGAALALDGDVLWVGAPSSPFGGSAHVFERSGGVWSELQTLGGGGFFGTSVAVSGGTAAVGELFDGTAGAVTVYERGLAQWSVAQILSSDSPVLHDEFGWALALEGERLVVGAPRQPMAAAGSVYVFGRAAGTWTQQQELHPSDGTGSEDFGVDLALDGDRLLVGCPALGGAYVFEWSAGSWSETAKLTAPGGLDGPVALDGDRALVGAHLFGHGGGGWQLEGLLAVDADPFPAAAADLDGGRALVGSGAFAVQAAVAFDLAVCECGTTTYCTTTPNSAGPGALISASGSTSTAANDLVLQVSGAVPGTFGIFFYGPEVALLPLGNGLRCVGVGTTGLFRLQPPQVADGLGQAARALDLTAFPANGGPGEVLPGSRWNFQYWYRDATMPPAGFNVSDALQAVFCP